MSDGPECFMENWPGNSIFEHKFGDTYCSCDLCSPHRTEKIIVYEKEQKSKIVAKI